MRWTRFRFAMHTVILLHLFVVGCASFMRDETVDEAPTVVELPETVGEVTRPHGLGSVTIESVGLVTGLPSTGSDPLPSPHREALLDEMRRRGVESPNQILAKDSTAVVLVRAMLPPGTIKGDRVDVEIRAPRRSKTESLEGGWLMETQLREVAILNQEVHSGHVRGMATGPVLSEALMSDGGAEVSRLRGVVLGGGVATKSRPIGLTLRSDHHSVSVSKLVAAAVNRRFDSYVRGKRQGAATPKTDKFIELVVHPRYRNNLIRYLRVIEQVQLRETATERLDRLKLVEGELLVPATASLAALKLEAIGDDATTSLLQGLDSPSPEVRFYAAEALAYLDHTQAAKYLAESAHTESAFRARALTALGAMSTVEAHEELSRLLHVASAETRYGAFCALREMNPMDPQLGRTAAGESLLFYEVESGGPPMVHIARTKRPEVVVFGSGHEIKTPLLAMVGKKLIVKGSPGGNLRITRYAPGSEDKSRECAASTNALLRALVEVDATYPEIVSTLQQAKQQECLLARLAFDAIPQAGRTYSREESTELASEPEVSTLR